MYERIIKSDPGGGVGGPAVFNYVVGIYKLPILPPNYPQYARRNQLPTLSPREPAASDVCRPVSLSDDGFSKYAQRMARRQSHIRPLRKQRLASGPKKGAEANLCLENDLRH